MGKERTSIMPTGTNSKFVGETLKRTAWSGPVIDLGAGAYADWYKPYFKDTKYMTLDLAHNAKCKMDYIADITNMPQVPSNTFGVALLLETLEHIKNPFAAFKEAARILKKDGILICTTVACWGIHDHPGDYFRFLPEGLKVLCEHAQLRPFYEELNPKDCTRPSHCMIAAKKE